MHDDLISPSSRTLHWHIIFRCEELIIDMIAIPRPARPLFFSYSLPSITASRCAMETQEKEQPIDDNILRKCWLKGENILIYSYLCNIANDIVRENWTFNIIVFIDLFRISLPDLFLPSRIITNHLSNDINISLILRYQYFSHIEYRFQIYWCFSSSLSKFYFT